MSASPHASADSADNADEDVRPSLDPARLSDATVERCTLTGPALALGTIAALHMASSSDGSIYVLDESGAVRRYVASSSGPCVLEYDDRFGTNGTLSGSALVGTVLSISTDRDGALYLGGTSGVVRLTHGVPTTRCEAAGVATVAPSGQFGLVTERWGPTTSVLRFDGTECSTSSWSPDPELARGDTLSILSDDRVAVAQNGLSLVNATGGARELVSSGVDEGYITASPTRAVPCGAGMCVLDMQLLAVIGYDAGHQEVGSASLRERVTVPLTWLIDMTAPVGSAVIVSMLEQHDAADPTYQASFLRVVAPSAP